MTEWENRRSGVRRFSQDQSEVGFGNENEVGDDVLCISSSLRKPDSKLRVVLGKSCGMGFWGEKIGVAKGG